MLGRENLLDFIRRYPCLYFRVMPFKKKYRNILVARDTDIVIEGYPRSANTYAVASFELAQANVVKKVGGLKLFKVFIGTNHRPTFFL